MSSLEKKSLNLIVCKGFVKKSSSCSLEEIGKSFKMPYWTFFLTTWQFILKYYILSWKIVLDVMVNSLWLSQYKTCGFEDVMCKNIKMYRSQTNSHIVEPRPWYSASKEDLDIVCCIFSFEETRDEPNKK